MNTIEQQQLHDALSGKDMEAYYRLDAALHPEQKRQYPPLAVTLDPEYQRLNSLAIDAQLSSDKWHDAMKLVANARDKIKGATEPESLTKFGDAQQEVLLAAAHVLGPFIGKAAGMKRMHQEEKERLRDAMRKLETNQSMVADDRWMKHAAEAIGETLEAMKGEAK